MLEQVVEILAALRTPSSHTRSGVANLFLKDTYREPLVIRDRV